MSLTTVFLGVLLTGSSGLQPDDDKNTEKGIIYVRLATQRARWILDVEVVDEDGKNLPNVEVTFPRGRADEVLARFEKSVLSGKAKSVDEVELGAEYADKKKVFSKDGKVAIDEKNCDALEFPLEFACLGYYPHKQTVDLGETRFALVLKAAVSALRTGAVPNEVRLVLRLRVVLQKKGTLTDLEPYLVKLEFAADGSLQVFQFGSDSDVTDCLSKRIQHKAVARLARGMSMKCDVGKDGKVIGFKEADSLLQSSFPRSFVITMHGGDGSGFVPFHMRRAWQVDWRKMRLAPVEGYVRELVFDEKKIAKWNQGEFRYWEQAYFFFRVDGFFGRGRIAEIDLSDDRTKFAARIELHLQPDASRNLESDGTEVEFFSWLRGLDNPAPPPAEGRLIGGASLEKVLSKPVVYENREKLDERFKRAFTGIVVDESRHPLGGVLLRGPTVPTSADIDAIKRQISRRDKRRDYPKYAESRYDDFLRRIEKKCNENLQNVTTSADGRFRIELPRHLDHNPVIVTKEGYYPGRSQNSETTLYKIGYPCKLNYVDVRLIETNKGRREAVFIDKIGNASSLPVAVGQLGSLRRCLSFEVERDPEGKLVLNGDRQPAAFKLRLHGPDGGFLQKERQSVWGLPLNWTMREAPPSGYRRQLAFPDWRERQVWFYFKMGAIYGRGSFSHFDVLEDRVEMSIHLAIQPDGTRNLEGGVAGDDISCQDECNGPYKINKFDELPLLAPFQPAPPGAFAASDKPEILTREDLEADPALYDLVRFEGADPSLGQMLNLVRAHCSSPVESDQTHDGKVLKVVGASFNACVWEIMDKIAGWASGHWEKTDDGYNLVLPEEQPMVPPVAQARLPILVWLWIAVGLALVIIPVLRWCVIRQKMKSASHKKTE